MSSSPAQLEKKLPHITNSTTVSFEESPVEYKSKNGVQKFLDLLTVQGQDDGLSLSEKFLYNEDLKPVLDTNDRPWTWWHYIYFWVSESFNVNAFQIASTGVVAGLAWWECWIAVWMGYGFCAAFMMISQRMGSHYHISFPVSARSSFGIFGSIWPIINRVVMACIWFSYHTWIGGQCVQLLLKAIFGTDLVTRIPNKIGSSGTTSFEFLCFFIYWICQLPFMYFRPQSIRWFFLFKSVVSSFAAISYLIWVLVRAHGAGSVIHEKTEMSSHDHGWAFINAMMSCISGFATLIINAPDFSRLATKPSDSSWTQFFAVPLVFAINALIGTLTASASKVLFGESYWSPLDILENILQSYTRGDRGGVFLIALAFTIAQVGTNISANSISFGTDCTALLPRFINIRRGSFLCALIAFCICPWKFFTTTTNFTTYLSAYAVFLSSIAGVVCADYCVIRKGYINIFHLYSNTQNSSYSFNRFGVNWRAFAAYIGGVAINVVGFAGAVGDTVPIGATYVYDLSFFTGYFSAFLSYLVLCYFFPYDGTPVKKWWTSQGWYEETVMRDDIADTFALEINENHPNEFVEGKFRYVEFK